MSAEKYRKIISNKFNKLPDWKIFEYLVALEVNALMWKDISAKLTSDFDVPVTTDHGIDLVDQNYEAVYQVKFSSDKGYVSWRRVSTFIAYGLGILDIDNLVLVISDNMTLNPIISRAIHDIRVYNFGELSQKYLLPVVPKPVIPIAHVDDEDLFADKDVREVPNIHESTFDWVKQNPPNPNETFAEYRRRYRNSDVEPVMEIACFESELTDMGYFGGPKPLF